MTLSDEHRDMSSVLARFAPGWPASIDCGAGWHGLVLSIDSELSQIDPDYLIHQVKEKFGELRFYFDTRTARVEDMIMIVRRYEELSRRTCEISGKPGVLMTRGGSLRTLSKEHAPEGYLVV